MDCAMTNQLQKHNCELVKENAELINKLLDAESEIDKLKLVNERLDKIVISLSDKVVDANSEIGRLRMMMKHNPDD